MKPLKPEKSCPLPNTHTRLHQVHRLWHQTQESYPNPEAFCTNLNAAIESIRSVTFLLQKEKNAIPDFDSWYAEWRTRLKKDHLMRWFVDARNKIEKEGDLETCSTARVSVLASWDGPQIVGEFTVNPLMSPDDIAEQFDKNQLPEAVSKEGVLIVDRRWIVSDLPEYELLDLLAYGYGVMASLVAEAHERVGFIMRTFTAESHDRPVRDNHLGGPLPCMTATSEMRIARYHLRERALLRTTEFRVQLDEKIGGQATARYGTGRGELVRVEPENVIDLSNRVADHAKRVLAADKYHQPIVTLYFPDRGCEILSLAIEDRQGLYLHWENLANRIKASGAIGLIFVSECWVGTSEEWEKGIRPTDSPLRTEALQVVGAASDGKVRVHTTPFSRSKEGKIVFGPTHVSDGTGQNPFSATRTPSMDGLTACLI